MRLFLAFNGIIRQINAEVLSVLGSDRKGTGYDTSEKRLLSEN